jgi:tetratricopeptide (TPR) repeat protein
MSKDKKIPPPLPRRLIEGLTQAETLLEQHKPAEARPLLAELDKRFPNRAEVLSLLVNTCYDQEDFINYEWAIYRLSRIERNDQDILTGLAGAYLLNNRPGLALRVFEDVLRRWPTHPRGAEIRKTIADLRIGLPTSIPAVMIPSGLSEAEFLDLVAKHDEVRFFLAHSQLHQCKQAAEALLKVYPGLIPVMNNLTLVHLIESNDAEARRMALAVLEIDAENIHALANLARIRFQDGDFAGVREMVERMAASSSQATERWVKLAETYEMLGDDLSLVALYARAEQSGDLDESIETAVLLHHSAVALARGGNERQARKLWEKALKLLPSYDLPRKNLEDMELPVGQRNGPWAHHFSFWVSEPLKQEMIKALNAPVKHKSGTETENAMRKFLRNHPGLSALLPHMLARGDADTREFAIRTIKMAETPDLIALMKEFALGESGSDKLRTDAATFLSTNGHLPPGAHRMWIQGKWTEILLMDWEITDRPTADFKLPATRKLLGQALEALQIQDGKRAQTLLEQALKLEESPSLFNNMALSLEMQGQHQAARAIMDRLQTRFPDYFFGICSNARVAIQQKNFDEARTLLNNLAQRKKLHVAEYNALCETEIQFAIATGNLDSARTWLQMWERVDPENPRLAPYRLKLMEPKVLDSMRKILKK